MAKDSPIEWTNHTFNPWWGCARVSPACANCYAEAWARRFGLEVWGRTAPRKTFSDEHWREPLRWDAAAARSRKRARVFCASMADVFEPRRDLDPLRERLWTLIEATPNLDWLLLTKRPSIIRRTYPWVRQPRSNVWLGTTAENQRWAERRVEHLVNLDAAVRFLSCEPLLSPLNLVPWLERGLIDWVIAGGESGRDARPTHPAWVRSLRDQCENSEVPFHFKQWGHWSPNAEAPRASRTIELQDATGDTVRLTWQPKGVSGRRLDGRTWDGLPGATYKGCVDAEKDSARFDAS
jgi:protein gp37